ncbi:aldo/keto reductase [Ancylobacter amanitiformis]|uniref:Aryl-alcohol dehydrogenase-like predicted oxidoreductase n=1 Tax=Ancylobacter amanitiformis TaxID=217069 RepID=A0ABU0LMW1_9HYPH|nr:aldo/keto reductase [Ancylobacter amanitiformis]MDQ0510037.1 aryl-alcohol dehydrogenase-like predicted oxidoreductase [Ancylobacter amanitiformis]
MPITPDDIAGSARVRLGHSDLVVRPVGLGCMGMSQFYGEADDARSTRTIREALDLGVDFIDTSDIYGAANMLVGAENRGFGHNEQLIGGAIAGRRDAVVLATKFAVRFTDDGEGVIIDGHPDYVASACEASLRRLGVEVIDLYYAHRLDPSVPVGDTVGAMGRLVEQGKVRAIGLSEVTPAQLRQAHGVHPITALQSEYSLWERGVEPEILPACRELGITFVPFSPLGRSMLTGAVSATTRFAAGDFRITDPRFSAENRATNLAPVEALMALAASKHCRPGQLALAWLLAQPFDIVAIPGTKRIEYVRENMAATNVALSRDEIIYLSTIFAPDHIAGARYAPNDPGRRGDEG